MASRTAPGEIVNDLINLISKSSFKRENREIELVLPWLRKRSQLLQNQETGVLLDIVRHCTCVKTHHDDVIIKQGDRGDCFYIVLRGRVSVYIDPKMTGEGDDVVSLPRGSAKQKRKAQKKKPATPSESDFSELSAFRQQDTQDEQKMEGKVEPEPEVTKLDDEAEPGEQEDDEDEGRKERPKEAKLVPLDRNKFGRHIVSYEPGKAFGELALVNHDSFRNATVIADEDTDLLVIGQDLFDRSLRAEQESRYEEIRMFIDAHPFFRSMTTKFKKLLEMSMRKETYIFDTHIVRQGEPIVGLHFLISGQAKIIVEPKKHKQQYLHLWPFEAGMDTLSLEFEHLREARKAAILRKYEDPSVWETKPEDLVIRRTEGYAAIEKRMQEKHISLCTVQDKEVLGDVETLLGLKTYMHSVRCTSNTEAFILDTKNWDRLVGKKNNTQTIDVMRAYVISKLSTRMNMRNADLIPFLGYLHQKLTEQTLPPSKKVEPFKMSKSIPDLETEMQHLLQYFREGKAELIIPQVRGLVYYKELMHEKAKHRETQKKQTKGTEAVKLRSLRKARPQRQPRSMLQIRESLRQMMEAEVIEFENQANKKKLKRKKRRDMENLAQEPPKHGITLDAIPKPVGHSQSQSSSPQAKTPRHGEDKAMRNPKPSLLALIQNAKRTEGQELSRDLPEPSDAVMELVNKKNQKAKRTSPQPSLKNDIDRKDTESITLPAIREEHSQEEIKLSAREVKVKSRSDSVQRKTPDQAKVKLDSRESPRKHLSASSFVDDTCIQSDLSPSPRPSKEASPSPRPLKDASPSPRFGKDPVSGRSLEVISPIKKTPRKESSPVNDRLVPGSNVPKLPSIAVDSGDDHWQEQTGERADKETGASKWQTAMSFVNERINKRLTKAIMEEETEFKDYETSEPSLRRLENKIKAFHVQYGHGEKTKNLPRLRRFKQEKLEDPSSPEPKPGGRVWIQRKQCKFSNSEYQVKDHSHVRYQIVESIPEFEKVQKSKVVLQQILKTLDVQH